MCYDCYANEYGKPDIVNEATKDAAKLIDAIYGFHCAGGNAHVVVDDYNLEDYHVDWCLNASLTDKSEMASAEQLKAEQECLRALKALSLDERASALAIHEGWLEA